MQVDEVAALEVIVLAGFVQGHGLFERTIHSEKVGVPLLASKLIRPVETGVDAPLEQVRAIADELREVTCLFKQHG